jgi:hypothetical protein
MTVITRGICINQGIILILIVTPGLKIEDEDENEDEDFIRPDW